MYSNYIQDHSRNILLSYVHTQYTLRYRDEHTTYICSVEQYSSMIKMIA
jgi:hypothetical protein